MLSECLLMNRVIFKDKKILICYSPSLQVVFCWLLRYFSEPYQHLFAQVNSSHMHSVSETQPLLPNSQNRDIHNNKVPVILCLWSVRRFWKENEHLSSKEALN